MPCLEPGFGWRSKRNGRWTAVEKYAELDECGNPIEQIKPCGKCLECRARRRRDLSIQAFCEAQFHPTSCFLTTTYAPEHLPTEGSLSKKRTQADRDEIRRRLSDYHWQWDEEAGLLVTDRQRRTIHPRAKFAYVISGEYGDTAGRPHEHWLFLGTDLKELGWAPAEDSDEGYHSRLVEDVMRLRDPVTGVNTRRGSHLILPVTINTAGYVAKYANKGDDATHDLDSAKLLQLPAPSEQHRYRERFKHSGEERDLYSLDVSRWTDHAVLDQMLKTLELVEVKEPQFVLRSKRPGLGHDYCMKYLHEIYEHDEINIRTKDGVLALPPPKYFDRIAARTDPELWERVRKKRAYRLQDPDYRFRRLDPGERAKRERIILIRKKTGEHRRKIRDKLKL